MDHEIPTLNDDLRWMRRALTCAQEAAGRGEVPVGAVVVRDGHLLGEAGNSPIGMHDPSMHAEVAAIRAACREVANYRLPGATLYVTLEPCTACFGVLMHARIARIVFGAREPRAGVLGSQLSLHQANFYNHQITVCEGLCALESSQLLTDFFRARRDRPDALGIPD